MNPVEQRLSAAMDAVTVLQEQLDQHHGAVVGIAPIGYWEDMTATVRECIEGAVELVWTDIEERRAA